MTASGTILSDVEKELTERVAAAADLAALEAARVEALGKKGRIPALLAMLGKMSPDERKSFGAAVNGVKERVAAVLEGRKAALEASALKAKLMSETADVTLPVRPGPIADGRIHPVSQVWDEISEIFGDMGFSVAEGPDIESEDFNFDKLNMPGWHPARQMMDTFYLKPAADGSRKVLRTHTLMVKGSPRGRKLRSLWFAGKKRLMVALASLGP